MGDMDAFKHRLRSCQRALAERSVDAIALFPSSNLYYVSGFREEPGERHLLLFVTAADAVFVAPSMYEGQLREQSIIDDIRTWTDGDDPTELVEGLADELDLHGSHILLDDRMWALFTEDLRQAIPDATFGLASEVFDDLRVRKDETELAHLREAARISDEVCEEIRRFGDEAIGLTEREIAHEIRMRLYQAGGDGFAFEPIVGSGPNGAQPHYRHGDRTIEHGEPVVLDFGTLVEGYPGDQTRTVVFAGDPPEQFEEAYAAVMDALEAGIETVGPGVEAQEVDRAARKVINDAGFEAQFLHRTGHGVGLEVHEAPYIVEGDDTVLEPGMVHSVEPGIYVEEQFGVRVEDLVFITEDGRERLNQSPHTWRPL